MKQFWLFSSGVSVGFLALACVVEYAAPIPRKKVMLEKSFMLDGKEWQCGYTSKQVEINLLEDKIKKIREQ